MKKFALLCTFLLSASVILAQQQPAPPPGSESLQAQQQPALGSEKTTGTKQVTGQVVSVDVPGKTITLKKDGTDPASQTLPVDAAALTSLKTLVPGEKVKLICKTDNSGREMVQSIEKDKSKTNPQ